MGWRGVHCGGLVTVLNVAVQGVLSEPAAFEQRFKEVKEQASGSLGEEQSRPREYHAPRLWVPG